MYIHKNCICTLNSGLDFNSFLLKYKKELPEFTLPKSLIKIYAIFRKKNLNDQKHICI